MVVHEVQPAALAADATAGGRRLPPACASWRLSKAQVARFFALSDEQAASKPHGFYDLPCTISGTLTAQGRHWHFTINAAGTAAWSSDGERRHWGCRVKGCAPLVRLMPDGLDPE